jgi:MSHA biogenesis protein MshL
MQGRKKLTAFFLACSAMTLSGCPYPTVPPAQGTAIDDIHKELKQDAAIDKSKCDVRKPFQVPGAVSKALIPSVDDQINEVNIEHRFDIVANKIPAKSFFMGLVEGTPYNVVLDPKVDGTITLNLKNVTILQAMQAVRDAYGYEFRRTSYGFEIFPIALQTQLFTVNYLDVKRTGKSITELTTGQVTATVPSFNTGANSTQQVTNFGESNLTSETSKVDTRTEMNFWKDLRDTLTAMVGSGDGRSVVVNAQAGVVMVKAFPADLRQIGRYLDRIQSTMNRQVILEAKVLEVQLNHEFQSGINWNLLGKTTGADGATIGGGVSQNGLLNFKTAKLNDFNSIFTLNIEGDFGALIKLLQDQGNVQVLSSPRISTVNNQKAVIKVGDDEFFVTGVSTSNIVVGNSTIPTQDVTLTPFFSGFTLDVTPQISADGTIVLHVHPSVSDVKDQTKSILLGTTVNNTPNTLILPLAQSTIRESDNIVRAKSGQVVVIGGLIHNRTTEEMAGVPGISKIPFIGAAFRRTQQISRKIELVILLRPIVLDKCASENDMEETDRRMQAMKRGFHWGGYPEVFGTQGETQDIRKMGDKPRFYKQPV